MIRLFSFSVILAMTLMTLSGAYVYGADKIHYKTEPTTKNDGKKWRIAYYQGGNYVDYQIILKALIKGLMEIGWVEPEEIPDIEDIDDTEELWKWMANDLKSQYIEFLADAYYTSNFESSLRGQTKEKFIQRLKNDKDIDVVLAFGTWAGQDLANNEHSTPTLVISSGNALTSKIIKDVEDSGYDHVHAIIDPERDKRQLELFHDIVGFKELGVVYENTIEGRSYASIDKIESASTNKERSFRIVTCHAKFSDTTDQEAKENVVACHKELAPKVDAVYITYHIGVNVKNMPELLAPLIEAKVPTFSQASSDEVKHGVLLSISEVGYKYYGIFSAETLAKVLNGAKPRDLDQVFESPPKIAINLATAVRIGFEPPIDILGAADDIYKEITTAK